MLTLRNYKIYKVDQYNYSFLVLRATKEGKAPSWERSYKYYGTIEATLEGIKRDLVQANFNNETDYTQDSFIGVLKELQEALNSLTIKISM